MSNTKKADLLFLSMIVLHIGVFFYVNIFKVNIVNTTNQSLILSQLLILIPTGMYLLLTRTNPVKLIRFKKIDIATIGMVALLTFLVMPLVTFINVLSMLFSKNTISQLSFEMAGNPFWLNLILMAVIPAISEEFVFRGVLFHTYRKSSVLYGAIVSGIAFGLMHLNFNQFSYALVLGIVFALLIEATGSIYATMIAHFIINGSSVVMMKASEKLMNFAGGSAEQLALQSQITTEYLLIVAAFYGFIAIGTTALAIGVYIWIVNHCNRVNHMRAVFMIRKGDERFDFRKVISIWLIVSVLSCIAFMFYYEAMSVNSVQTPQTEQNTEAPADDTL